VPILEGERLSLLDGDGDAERVSGAVGEKLLATLVESEVVPLPTLDMEFDEEVDIELLREFVG
jgi:hypothetical protein